MQNKIVINKAFLQKCKSVSLILENCDDFEIGVKDIIDVSLVATINKKDRRNMRNIDDTYSTTDGFIKISSNAKDVLSWFAYEDGLVLKNGKPRKNLDTNRKEDLEGLKLYNRLSTHMNMCAINFNLINDKNVYVYPPYDPVCEVFHGCEIEMSSCPSFETDENGDFLIKFGKLSNVPVIARNNYSEIIEGWGNVFKKKTSEIFEFKLYELRNIDFGGDTTCIVVSGEYKGKTFELKFYDCYDVYFDLLFKEEYFGNYVDLYITKLLNGDIYVGIGCQFSTYCKRCKIETD